MCTDSTSTLSCIRGDYEKLGRFVKHRVNEIAAIADPILWRYFPGEDNPSDLLTRGVSLKALRTCRSWWRGPEWLSQPKSTWPTDSDMSTPIYEESECDTQHALIQAPENVDSLMDSRKFSKLQKLLPVTAWVSWFADLSRPTQTSLGGTISTEELNLAEMFRICRVQLEVFTNDIEHLRLRDTAKKHSVLRDLHPHLDHSGQLRLRGRLENMDATKPFTICPAHFFVGHSFYASPEPTNSDYGAQSAQATRRDLIEEPIFSRSIWPLGRVVDVCPGQDEIT
ncbi:hypothetical protein HPB49_002215 [Dermacentor silvarum]|uniref:Uncharacterized protein n=1 Tax=Dermacentor silvarum TaxID=543639 RepID=A0ACB8CP21_DERSI|nr:hypothetical protein HPB49_002215 [Dermacentor silvarum]